MHSFQMGQALNTLYICLVEIPEFHANEVRVLEHRDSQ
jgi:hypothetical protein